MIIIESLLFRMQKLMKTLPTLISTLISYPHLPPSSPTLISHPHLHPPTLISTFPPSSPKFQPNCYRHQLLHSTNDTLTDDTLTDDTHTDDTLTDDTHTNDTLTDDTLTKTLLMTPYNDTLAVTNNSHPAASKATHTPTLPLSLASGFSSIMVMMVLTMAFLYS